MYPDLPPDTWEPDPPFHWIEDGEDKDTEGGPPAPLGGSSDGPEPDAISEERRNESPGEWFCRVTDSLLAVGARVVIIVGWLLFVLFCWGVWKVVEWVVDTLPK